MTITGVEVTGDLQHATIYYSTLSNLASDAEKTQIGLDKATGLIRRELGQRLRIYVTPEWQQLHHPDLQFLLQNLK